MRGAVAPHFIQDGRRVGGLPKFKRDVEILKSWDGNFVSVVWNSGYTSDTFYVESLVSALEFARSLGLRVELVLHSRGLKTVSGGEITNQEIRIVNDQLINDWAALLGNTSATRIAKSVDMYGILSEPVNNADGGTATWEQTFPVFDKACNTIRSKISNDNAICAYSGLGWAGDARGLLQIKPTRSNVAIEIHPYQPQWNETRFPDYVVQLNPIGYNILVGEIGWNNDPAFVRQQVEFLKANGISFAFWAIVGGRTETDRLLIDQPNGTAIPTALGVIAQEALK